MADYVLKVSRYNAKQRASNEIHVQEEVIDENKVANVMDVVEDAVKERDHDFIVKLIQEHFSTKLFGIVEDFYKHRNVKTEA